MIDPENYNWSRFELTYYYNAHITRVFRVWTESRGLESFFISRSVYTRDSGNLRDDDEAPQTGDLYDWEFRQGFSLKGSVTAFVPKEKFSFTFGQMQVELFFRVLDNQTEVHLVQTKIPDTADGKVFGHLNCRSCWIFFMTNLTSVLDYGKDLRDENSELVSSMEVGFIPVTQRSA
jgi:uncharacterized protein YndB with AHSA1/START domain